MKNHAFTLIELLVVVLIIGILAAIAVPQYQKAIIKTKYNRLKSQTTTLQEATNVYMLAHNGTYPPSLDDLDVSSDNKGVMNNIDGVYCSSSPNIAAAYLFCRDINIDMAYAIVLDGKRYCIPYADSGYKVDLCKAETGNQPDSAGRYRY